jgi:hypothetical protein
MNRPRRRRPYAPPRLVDHGPIPARALSNSAAGSVFDVVKGMPQKKTP